MLLFATLLARGRVGRALDSASSTLLGHLSLLFVPAGVGVMVHFELIGREWLPILVALAVSTLLGLVISGWTMQLAGRLSDGDGDRS